jgi:hypothetical protein
MYICSLILESVYLSVHDEYWKCAGYFLCNGKFHRFGKNVLNVGVFRIV